MKFAGTAVTPELQNVMIARMIADRTLRGKLENSPIVESFRVVWDYVTDVDWHLAAKPT